MEKENWRMLNAAIDGDPDKFGKMTPQQEKKFWQLVQWVKERKAANPNVEFTCPVQYDWDD